MNPVSVPQIPNPMERMFKAAVSFETLSSGRTIDAVGGAAVVSLFSVSGDGGGPFLLVRLQSAHMRTRVSIPCPMT